MKEICKAERGLSKEAESQLGSPGEEMDKVITGSHLAGEKKMIKHGL